ncbi:unnamed protein product [Ectocarpus sp. 8 AP-2014]
MPLSPACRVRKAANQAARSGPCCTPRLTFWISCALGWVVWVFAVAASADDKWAKIDGFDIGAGDEDILDDCDSSDDVCSLYKAFTAMQFIAAVVVSVSMVLFTLALFRPAAGLKCCSVKSLAIAAGSLMMAFAFFEMLAFVLIIVIEKELDGESSAGFDSGEADLGATFGVAVVAVVLGVVQAVSVLTFARSSGDGPFFKCFNECMTMNNAPHAAAVPTQQQQQQQQQPPPPPQQQQQQPPLRTAVFASAASTQAPAPAPTGPAIPAAAAPVPAGPMPAEPASTAV